MIYCFYVSASLGFLLLQTTLIPVLPVMDQWYDLLIPFVVYLGITRPARESLPVVFSLGFIMDSLSGAPFGLYSTTYFWSFVGVKALTQILQIGDRFLIVAMIVAVGVVVENFVFFATFLMMETENPFATNGLKSTLFQVLWAAGTGPLVLIFCRKAHHRLENSLKGIFYQQRQLDLP